MSDSVRSIVPLAGRLLISAIFIFSGLSKLGAHAAMAGFAASKGFLPRTWPFGSQRRSEFLGGLSILLGFQARIAAWVLFLFLIPTTLCSITSGHYRAWNRWTTSTSFQERGDHGRIALRRDFRRWCLFDRRGTFEKGLEKILSVAKTRQSSSLRASATINSKDVRRQT